MNNSAQTLTQPNRILSEKIDVLYSGSGTNPTISLQYSTWRDDLGWCVQRTIPVNVEMLDDLHRALTAARCKVKSAVQPAEAESNNVIAFPQVSRNNF